MTNHGHLSVRLVHCGRWCADSMDCCWSVKAGHSQLSSVCECTSTGGDAESWRSVVSAVTVVSSRTTDTRHYCLSVFFVVSALYSVCTKRFTTQNATWVAPMCNTNTWKMHRLFDKSTHCQGGWQCIKNAVVCLPILLASILILLALADWQCDAIVTYFCFLTRLILNTLVMLFCFLSYVSNPTVSMLVYEIFWFSV